MLNSQTCYVYFEALERTKLRLSNTHFERTFCTHVIIIYFKKKAILKTPLGNAFGFIISFLLAFSETVVVRMLLR